MEDEADGPSLEEIGHWKMPALKDFLRVRGLKTTGRKAAELQALAYSAVQLGTPVKPNEIAEDRARSTHKQNAKATKRLFNPLGNGRNMPTAAGLLDAMYPPCQDSTVLSICAMTTPPPPTYPPEADFNLGTQMETETVVESTPLLRQFFPRVNRRTGYQEYTKFTREVHLITSRKVLVVKPKGCELSGSPLIMAYGGGEHYDGVRLPARAGDAPKWQTKLGGVLAVVLGDVPTVQRIDRLKARLKTNPSNNFMKAEFDNCVAHSNSCGEAIAVILEPLEPPTGASAGLAGLMRGTSFREEYRKVPSVRGVLNCPVLMLTATATETMVEEIIRNLHLSNVDMVPVLPNRAMEEYREDFAFEESIENEAVCQIRKQIYEKRTVKVIKHLSLLQQDFCTRLALRAMRTEDSRHHCN
ncbi:hypothetical protein Bbelb_200590 [Branchiostoma belcheri]|nr:hypothetical protein Bbelb_200590 [Branchiostoma belcheri]